ncbi:MAG: hypothetical protein WC486_06140 [Candidatus Omnitrophota bacterium]
MSKVNFRGMIGYLATVMIFFGGNTIASADVLYGCAKDGLVMANPGQCPVCSEALSVVQEGYIYNRDKVVLDTLSDKEKEDLKSREELNLLIIVYRSASGEASFAPGVDKKGAPLQRQIVHLAYDCGDALSSRSFSDKCKQSYDTPESLQKERDEDLAKAERVKAAEWEEQQKARKEKLEADLRVVIGKEIDESWPKFYKNQKKSGLNEQQINAIWEAEKLKVYQKYNYDPETDTFGELEELQTGGEE